MIQSKMLRKGGWHITYMLIFNITRSTHSYFMLLMFPKKSFDGHNADKLITIVKTCWYLSVFLCPFLSVKQIAVGTTFNTWVVLDTEMNHKECLLPVCLFLAYKIPENFLQGIYSCDQTKLQETSKKRWEDHIQKLDAKDKSRYNIPTYLGDLWQVDRTWDSSLSLQPSQQ